MARINYDGVQMDAAPEKVIPVLNRLNQAGIGVVGMKVLGVGRFGEDVVAAVDYVLGLGSVHAITIGIIDQTQLVENIHAVARRG
jgi:hypothetical protein